jgi:hypothetical protein
MRLRARIPRGRTAIAPSAFSIIHQTSAIKLPFVAEAIANG